MLLVIVLVVVLIGALLYCFFKKPPINELESYLDNSDISNDSPLTEQTFKNLSLYADRKQDSRIDAIMDNLSSIKFWVSIIGVYFLIQLIKEIFKIFLLFSLGYEFNEALQYLFNLTF